jgi:peptidoglycan biosynthesis protein MviN/MurJ (putative lipid II flippase)
MITVSAIRERLRNAHPDHYAIGRGMAWVILFVFLGKLAGAAKEMAVAYRYGVSADVDAYLFLFNLVSWPVGIWFSVLTVVLVPLAARIRHDTSVDLPRFRAELLGLTLLLGMCLMLFALLGLPLLLRSPWTGLPPNSVIIATNMVSSIAMLAPLGVLISLLSAWMLSAGRHANTLLESVPALVILATILAFPGGGVEPLVWGTVAGFAFHLVSLAVPLARRGEIETPRFNRQSPQWSVFWQGFGIMMAGQAVLSFIVIIDQFFAAHLEAGSIATLSYANRILALILGLGATAVTRATLPVFSQAQAHAGESRHLNRVAGHWVRLLFVFGVVTMIVGWLLAPWVVKLLFERGAFTARNTEAVTEVFRYGLVQLPFYFAGMVLVTLLASQGAYRAIAIVASLNLLVKAAMNFGFVPWFGLKGLLLSTGLMYFISCTLYWITVRRKIKVYQTSS